MKILGDVTSTTQDGETNQEYLCDDSSESVASEEENKSIKELLHKAFVATETDAEEAAEVSANIGCTALISANVAQNVEGALNWLDHKAAEMSKYSPILTSFSWLCDLGATVAQNTDGNFIMHLLHFCLGFSL